MAFSSLPRHDPTILLDLGFRRDGIEGDGVKPPCLKGLREFNCRKVTEFQAALPDEGSITMIDWVERNLLLLKAKASMNSLDSSLPIASSAVNSGSSSRSRIHLWASSASTVLRD
ncbi:hypothetical protein V6N12_076095 [Hibiscus sabdariffa]|uniref:Uncharacterized protein n=1 Tax=Hibiscus sabdariffa TaxID=183260 RepID=A0ABR2AYV3_9ROSI